MEKDDLAKVMKKNLLRNRSITQPKLLSLGQIPPENSSIQSSQKGIDPVVQGMVPQKSRQFKATKNKFLALNKVEDDGDSRFNASYSDIKLQHMVPSAMYEDRHHSL